MSNVKINRDLPLIEQNWNYFISLIKQDLDELIIEQRKIEIEIKKAERTERILKICSNDINFLIAHKELFIQINDNLESKFKILEAFKKRENLDNDLAVFIYQEILNDDKVIYMINQLESLINKSIHIQDTIDSLKGLIYGDDYSQMDLISDLCKKHSFDSNIEKMLYIYPIIKTLRKNNISKKKEESQSQILEESTKEEIIQVNSEDNDDEIEILSFKNLFDVQKDRYNTIKESQNELLSKYYVILQQMKPYEAQFYRSYCSYSEINFKDMDKSQFENGYDEALSIIYAMKAFDAKAEIESVIKSLILNNYYDKEEIEYLEEFINEFQSICNKLREVDEKIIDKTITLVDESKVFFLLDKNNSTFVPEEIIIGSNRRSLINIIEKAEEGIVSNKRGCNIMPLKINDKKFGEELGKTLFAIRNTKILVSYIKLNSDSEISNNGGIIILTSCPIVEGTNGIQSATDKIIRDNKDELLRQIRLIESKDQNQIELQSLVRNGILKYRINNIEEGETNGFEFR